VSKKVVITGGGTGGHLSVAKSFIEEFYKRGYEIIFIGSSRGQDKQWFEHEDKISQKYFFETKGVVNQSFLGKFVSLWMIFKAVLKSIKIMKKNDVKKVISVGGFSAASGSFGAIASKRDFYIHEQNSVMGKLNKISAKYAKEVFCSYIDSSKVKDYPINGKFFENQRVREDVKTVIFLGGSQGAKAINDFALKVAPRLNEMGIEIIHQAGKNDIDRVQKEYEKLGLDVDVFAFSTNLLQKMQKADFAISRAGASTLWELVALGIPTFFIPFPYAAADHQYYNAKYLLDNGLCFLQRESELSEEYLFDSINSDIKEKSEKLINLISNNAIEKIVDVIEEKS
jgi:UDP-N-acetylglucosamine--N-acetylmuramyl-(pentapeptide) pyrophosphoryl-undecaprenol N-acetylglucosamine transferase